MLSEWLLPAQGSNQEGLYKNIFYSLPHITKAIAMLLKNLGFFLFVVITGMFGVFVTQQLYAK